ncbi:copper resistance protein NlpE [Flavobacterium sp. MFBS3-15]|uniref:copper resistance protein NlpE n=1 Tax=Flavobacterium sp. MFBS3-15 TaxID=2989816 RepID=UPI0022356155|nr:copper resistance protein NlpE [Flavobacterium sp. MFBS3-15]MCW4470632.1 copper resistance protein NlpE [Flavobacterium sp. MFBS3-15]
MKSMLLLCLAAAVMVIGCKDGEKATSTQDTTALDTTRTAMPAVKPQSTWMGKYAGTLPCWKDCDGLKTEIEVRSDSTYTLASQALGQEDKPRVFNGTYHFDTAKSTITLDAEGDHLKFLVGDGMLKKLDKFGDPEQGAPQENYLLKRVE